MMLVRRRRQRWMPTITPDAIPNAFSRQSTSNISAVATQHPLNRMAPPSKRRKIDALRRQKPVEQLTFSIDARQEYLTGFSKRKQARKEQAREQAIKEAKEEKIRDRKEVSVKWNVAVCCATSYFVQTLTCNPPATRTTQGRPGNPCRRGQQSSERTRRSSKRQRPRRHRQRRKRRIRRLRRQHNPTRNHRRKPPRRCRVRRRGQIHHSHRRSHGRI